MGNIIAHHGVYTSPNVDIFMHNVHNFHSISTLMNIRELHHMSTSLIENHHYAFILRNAPTGHHITMRLAFLILLTHCTPLRMLMSMVDPA
jgi:hypothetical protein